MQNQSLYPLMLQPSLHIKVWGGKRLKMVLNKCVPSDDPYGESWELHDSAIVGNGLLAGKTLGELATEFGEYLLGDGMDAASGFPLLAKFIDADSWLSVQVHPNDEQARELEGEPRGKTEAWVVIHAEPDARLVLGCKPGATREAVANAIGKNLLEDLLHYSQVRAGDVLYIPANTIHALGPGLLIYEIQQSSDTTYRLYDWGRMGLDGKPRQLHIDKGLQVSDLAQTPSVGRPIDDLIVDGPYFMTWRHQLETAPILVATEQRFHALTCISGTVRVGTEGHDPIVLAKGETALIPACLPAFAMRGMGTILRSCQKTPQAS